LLSNEPTCCDRYTEVASRLEQLSASSGVSPAFADFLGTMGDVRGKLSRRLHTTVGLYNLNAVDPQLL
jgi:hypothetical protein